MPQNESPVLSLSVRASQSICTERFCVSVRNSILTPETFPLRVCSDLMAQKHLSSPTSIGVTLEYLRQNHHLCWTLFANRTVIHELFKIFLFSGKYWLFFFFLVISCLIQMTCNNPTFKNKWRKVHCIGLRNVFYKDILEKRTPNLWGKWIWLWQNSSKQRSLLPGKFRLNAHELLSYLVGWKPRGRITELTVRLLLQTLGFHRNRN